MVHTNEKKYLKTDNRVNYTEKPDLSQGKCRDCTKFRSPLSCSAVRGVIKPTAHCDLWPWYCIWRGKSDHA